MRRVVVIGLGIFGSQLARQLYEGGLEVVAIDKNKDVVQRMKDYCTKAVRGRRHRQGGSRRHRHPRDGHGGHLLRGGPLGEHPAHAPPEGAEGQGRSSSRCRTRTTSGSCSRWARARPSSPSAKWPTGWRASIISPNVLEYLPISEDYTIAKLAPPTAFIGKSLADLDLRKRYNLQVIAIRDVLTDKMQLVPRAGSVLKDSDVLVIIGQRGGHPENQIGGGRQLPIRRYLNSVANQSIRRRAMLIGRGDRRQGVGRVPAGLADLVRVDPDLALRVLGREGDHERVREGPGLAAEVADGLHPHADLFEHLPPHALLEGLPGLDKPGQHAEKPGRETVRVRQQQPAVPHDRHDDRRRHARVIDEAAAGAELGALARCGPGSARRSGRRTGGCGASAPAGPRGRPPTPGRPPCGRRARAGRPTRTRPGPPPALPATRRSTPSRPTARSSAPIRGRAPARRSRPPRGWTADRRWTAPGPGSPGTRTTAVHPVAPQRLGIPSQTPSLSYPPAAVSARRPCGYDSVSHSAWEADSAPCRARLVTFFIPSRITPQRHPLPALTLRGRVRVGVARRVWLYL